MVPTVGLQVKVSEQGMEFAAQVTKVGRRWITVVDELGREWNYSKAEWEEEFGRQA